MTVRRRPAILAAAAPSGSPAGPRQPGARAVPVKRGRVMRSISACSSLALASVAVARSPVGTMRGHTPDAKPRSTSASSSSVGTGRPARATGVGGPDLVRLHVLTARTTIGGRRVASPSSTAACMAIAIYKVSQNTPGTSSGVPVQARPADVAAERQPCKRRGGHRNAAPRIPTATVASRSTIRAVTAHPANRVWSPDVRLMSAGGRQFMNGGLTAAADVRRPAGDLPVRRRGPLRSVDLHEPASHKFQCCIDLDVRLRQRRRQLKPSGLSALAARHPSRCPSGRGSVAASAGSASVRSSSPRRARSR